MCVSRFPLISTVALLATVAPVLSQQVFDPIEDLEFEAPEAWAMNYFASATLPTGGSPASDLELGGFELGLEVLQLPHLDQEQRTVGFGGFKEEDLNRSPAAARISATLGLGAGWRLEAGWAPPVEIDGVEADLWSLALERDLWRGARAGIGMRLHAQSGEITGDLTCTAGKDERFPPGSAANPFGCEAPSRDEMRIDSVGFELLASIGLGRSSHGPQLHGGFSWNQLDTEFQVDALTFGFRDRSLLRSDGDTFTVRSGLSWLLGRNRFGTEVFWAPLEVRRPAEGSLGATETDDLIHLRLTWTRRLR